MGSFSIWHWLVVLLIIMLLFGANRIPQLMGDVARGIRSFKSGLREDEDQPAAPPAPRQIDAPHTVPHAAGPAQTPPPGPASASVGPAPAGRIDEPARH